LPPVSDSRGVIVGDGATSGIRGHFQLAARADRDAGAL